MLSVPSFAELLEQLQAKEEEFLAAEAVQHAPTIGDIYESLSLDVEKYGCTLRYYFALDSNS